MAARRPDSAIPFFDYGLDLPSRTLYLGSATDADDEGGTDYRMADRAVKGLHLLDLTPGEITIKTNNPGGDEYHGMAIYDAIKLCSNHVRMIGFGMIMSMGGWIMQAADERLMTPNATFMVHYGTMGYDGHATDFQRVARESERLSRLMEAHFLERMREKHPDFTAETFRQKFQFDTYLSAQDALALGLIDRILE